MKSNRVGLEYPRGTFEHFLLGRRIPDQPSACWRLSQFGRCNTNYFGQGHPQPPVPIHCDNATATGIANDTVKKQCARSMEMRFFWVTDQVKQRFFNVQWQPGQENLADYFTKHFEPRHHLNVRPWYLIPVSPLLICREPIPRAL